MRLILQVTVLLNRLDRRAGSALVTVIAWYQRWLGPLVGNACRFEPSCSRYTQHALQQHGAMAGTCLGLGRICRCHPYSRGGLDPVPERLTLASFFYSTNKSSLSDGSQT